jgi:HTH-type transcriptional regulator, transcriptional repressor of NAD biosynthesis genes
MRRYKNGLIVGKFAPLHKGHEFLINRAKEKCENVFIISYCNPEIAGFEAEKRQMWLQRLYPDLRHLIFDSARAAEKLDLSMPLDSDSDDLHREFVANLWLKTVNRPLDLVFTSESYGDGFAQHLTNVFEAKSNFPPVRHKLVDLGRSAVPISGTQVRADVHAFKDFLSPVVYSSFVKRVCFLGAESTGKSTLVAVAAKRYRTNFVNEYGRDLWSEKGGSLEYEDMLRIAKRHIANEETVAGKSNRLMFIDTSPLTTLLYSYHMFDRAEPELLQLSYRPYDYTFLCAPDFEYVQDGTRAGRDFQTFQHQEYLRLLKERQVDFKILSGTVEDRMHIISETLSSKTAP